MGCGFARLLGCSVAGLLVAGLLVCWVAGLLGCSEIREREERNNDKEETERAIEGRGREGYMETGETETKRQRERD